MDYAWTGRSPSVIRGFRPSALSLREGILDGTFLASQPLPSEGALAKQFGVTRPTVHQRLPERTPGIGSCRSHQGPRHLRLLRTHSRPSHTRSRRTPAFGRQPHQGRRRPLNRRRTAGSHPHRHSTGPTGPTSHPAGRADAHVRRTADRKQRPYSSTPPDGRPVLGAHRHQIRGRDPTASAGALHAALRPGPRAPLHGVHAHPHASTRPGSGATTGRRGPEAPRHPRDPHRGGQAPHPGGVPPSTRSWSCRSGCSKSWVAQTFSTSSRRLAPLTARGTGAGRACAPVSAPLQPGRRPCRAHSNQPPDARGGRCDWRSRPPFPASTATHCCTGCASPSPLTRNPQISLPLYLEE
ncbi:GntR family transcriptional regulator [Streptomyces olivaceus]